MALLIGVNFLIRTKNGMTASYQSKDELLSALKWQADMGIDCALRDTAIGLYAADMAQMPVTVSAPVSASTSISAHPPSKTPSVTALADTMPSIPHTFGDDASCNALPCARARGRLGRNRGRWDRGRRRGRRRSRLWCRALFSEGAGSVCGVRAAKLLAAARIVGCRAALRRRSSLAGK